MAFAIPYQCTPSGEQIDTLMIQATREESDSIQCFAKTTLSTQTYNLRFLFIIGGTPTNDLLIGSKTSNTNIIFIKAAISDARVFDTTYIFLHIAFQRPMSHDFPPLLQDKSTTYRPPVVSIKLPVTNEDLSEASHNIASATS